MQSPKIEKKLEDIQYELVTFREKYNLIEPAKEGELIKDQQKVLEEEINSLIEESNRLKSVRNEIENG